ncbi:MAG: DNA polymerase Y family protein [Salinisphaera sp.]|uniref:Y-family DNA polymerase n=1 Tax=Salinisphaera sp. TaxID=1914330 RepID=UPI003C7B98F3
MWLALRFPNWGLDCRGVTDERPILVVETTNQRQQVVAASRTARSHGVRLGMGLVDARMRLPEMALLDRSRSAETAAIARLAGWAWRYSSQIHWSIVERDIECARLILEIGASLRLFGGRRALLAAIRDDLESLGYRYRAGLGDTPQAALAFSRVQRSSPSATGLAGLPLACLDLDNGTRSTLRASGFRWAGELLALPPSTLARRFGKMPLAYLEQLRGRRPHELQLYELPERYRTQHELIGAVESTQGLIFVLRRVFTELSIFLRGADSAIQTLQLSLIHERQPTTRITLRLSAPSHDARHLERVACERLERITLGAPVLGIGLVSDRLRPADHQQGALWRQSEQSVNDAWPGVLDRLRARLGHQAVQWLDAPNDHRPERASVERDSAPSRWAAFGAGHDALPRPLWLLEPPEPIDAEAIEAMRWISGPERIESGWWDIGQRRDYYRAVDTRGRLIWLFRELDMGDTTGSYFLHGLFG